MSKKIRILLVEDNPADVDLTKETLDAAKILHELFVVYDGMEAMEFLQQKGKYTDAPKPQIIFLDLNLPKKDGREVLEEIKADPSLRRIPVVVLTSSRAEEDVARTYDLQASAYVTKPVDLEGFGKIVQGIDHFWFSVVRFSSE